MIKYTFAKTSDALYALQDKAITAAKSARIAIQVAAVATVHHMVKHRDYTIASRLVDGLGETINAKSLVEWFKEYGGLTVGEITTEVDGKQVKRTTFNGLVDNHEQVVRERFDEAKQVMWWELVKVNAYKGFSLELALKNVLNQAKKAQAKLEAGEVSADDVDVTHVNDATIKAVLALCKFETIAASANDEQNEQVAA